MYCSNCGKEIKDGAAFCPKCGSVQVKKGREHPELHRSRFNQGKTGTAYNTLCIIGIVISGLSLFLPLFGATGIIGFILSWVALGYVAETGERGRELALAGMIIGAVTAIYGIITALMSASILFHVASHLEL